MQAEDTHEAKEEPVAGGPEDVAARPVRSKAGQRRKTRKKKAPPSPSPPPVELPAQDEDPTPRAVEGAGRDEAPPEPDPRPKPIRPRCDETSPFGFPGPTSPIAIHWRKVLPLDTVPGEDPEAPEGPYGDFGGDPPPPLRSDALGFEFRIDYLTYFRPKHKHKHKHHPSTAGGLAGKGELVTWAQEIVPWKPMVVVSLSEARRRLSSGPRLAEALAEHAAGGIGISSLAAFEVVNGSFPFSLTQQGGQAISGQLSLDLEIRPLPAPEDPSDAEPSTDPGPIGTLEITARLFLARLAGPGQRTLRHLCLAAVTGSIQIPPPPDRARRKAPEAIEEERRQERP